MRRYISILIVAISIAATSCSNFLVKEESTPPEGAFVSLAVGSPSSRTILPESYDEVASLVNFTFTATSTAGEEVTQTFTDYDTLQTARIPIALGTYDCKLSATSTGGIKYEGVLEDTVIAPGDNTLAFKLQVVQLSADPGSLEVQLTFPGTNVAVVKAGLYSIAGEALDGFPEEVLAISGGSTVTYSKDRVPGGSYVIQFSFYGDAECTVFLGMHTESVVIVSGKKSAATRSIESINQMYTITYELDGGSFVEGYTPPRKFTPNMELQLPKVSEVQKPGEGFLGWYTDAAFTGSPVYSIPRGTGENKTYYAKWGIFTAETIDEIDLGSVAGDCNLVISGLITSETISTLTSKLTATGTSAKIHLDLSQTTGLTSIGESAFSRYSRLTSVEIPASVTSIGNYAFDRYSGLTSVTFGEGSQLESIGSYAFRECRGLTSVEIPASVTSIGEKAFYCCSGLTSVEIPASVTSIGDYAFDGCSGLTSVEIPAGVVDSGLFPAVTGECRVVVTGEITGSTVEKLRSMIDGMSAGAKIRLDLSKTTGLTSIGFEVFRGCSGLASVTFGEGSQLESIGSYAFRECSGLTSVEIPASVTSIGDDAFYGCSRLTSVTFGEGSQLESIGSYAFRECSGLTSVEIPASVTSIGEAAFRGCSGLTSVEIPAGVTSIGSWVFYGCSGLTSVEIPAGVTSIGSWVFHGCSGLTSVEIPAGVTSIGDHAFHMCSGLTSVEIPAGVTSIGDYAFYDCTGLTRVEIPASVTSIGESAFDGCSGLTSVTFGEGSQLESIGYLVFYRCRGLTRVEIPASVTSIGEKAFLGCSGLTSVEIPAGVTSIGGRAFSGCSGLTRVEIPASVTSIGYLAFWGCSGLTSVEIPAGVTSIGYGPFRECSGLTSVTFGDTSGWYVTTSETDAANKTGGTAVTLSSTNLAANAKLVNDTYDTYYWYKVD